MSTDSQLFHETFTITALDHQKYDRVGRVTASSSDSQTALTLDINTDLFPISPGETIQCMLASTLNLDGTKDDFEGKGWRDLSTGEATLADLWQYVCFGRVYRFEEGDESKSGSDAEKLRVFVSFGGLLLFLEGPYRKLTGLRVDHVYLLLKK